MKIKTCAALLAAALLAPTGTSQNLLVNADFEAGFTGWSAFGNASAVTANPPAVVPFSGSQLAQLFGNFSGGFDVSGIFQAFPATPGQSFTIDAWSRHFSGDRLTGAGAPTTNWVVMKMAFFNSGGAEIGGAEGTILDGNSPTDVWIDNAPVTGTAPAGTATVQCLILFLQPGNDPGAAQIEDVSFTTSAPPVPASGNLLLNGGFETGLDGWDAFGNSFAEAANPPAVVPRSGTGIAKLFGNFSGGFNVSGLFQNFGAVAGQSFTMDAWSRHFAGDPMTGGGAPNDNWVVMKIAFFDAGGVEIGGTEGTILDGTSPTDTWIDNPAISATAPAGTASVQALILYLQPNNAGGAAQIDDVVFSTTSDCDLAQNGGFETGDLSGWLEFPSAPGNISIMAPGSGSGFAACINNTAPASASLIKNANLGVGTTWPNANPVQSNETIVITFDAKGSTAVGGVAFAELFSELAGGGVSLSEILGGAPLALDPDPNVWKTFRFTTMTGPDVSGGVTLQLAAITGAATGSAANICFDNVSITVERVGPTWSNYGAGWPGTNGVPSLRLAGNPIIGQTVTIQLGNSSGTNALGALLFGDQRLALPTPLGGTLLNNAVVPVSGLMLSPTGGTVSLSIPNNNLLCGVELFGQLIHVDAGASASVAFSRGLRFVFGG